MKHTTLGMATVWVAGTLATSAWALEWTKSKYGPDDELGAANLITPQSVIEAAKLVKTGKTYNLGIVVNSKTPAFPPCSMSVTILQPNQISSSGLGPTKTTYNDGIFTGWFGIGPKIDHPMPLAPFEAETIHGWDVGELLRMRADKIRCVKAPGARPSGDLSASCVICGEQHSLSCFDAPKIQGLFVRTFAFSIFLMPPT